jgi:putative ABC transport system permease protein
VLGGTTHKLDIDDAEALRQVPGVTHLAPLVMGQAKVEGGGRGRSVYIYGGNYEIPEVWSFEVAQGEFLPEIDPRRQGAHAVLGPKLSRELFDERSPVGERVRIGGRSFLVVGVLAPKGRLLGIDLDDAAYVAVASAMALFEVDELNEIDVVAESAEAIPRVAEALRETLRERHRDREDFTITTQAEILESFGRIINMVTVAVSGIAAISLLVGAIGILTIMWISVHERTHEIGLLRALGVTPARVSQLFLLESMLVAILGGFLGIVVGAALGLLLRLLMPGMPFSLPPLAITAALLMSAGRRRQRLPAGAPRRRARPDRGAPRGVGPKPRSPDGLARPRPAAPASSLAGSRRGSCSGTSRPDRGRSRRSRRSRSASPPRSRRTWPPRSTCQPAAPPCGRAVGRARTRPRCRP